MPSLPRIAPLARLSAIVMSCALPACADDAGASRFQFDVVVNNRTDGAVEIVVDGVAVPLSGDTINLEGRDFSSYDLARQTPLQIETRRDGQLLEVCDLYAGACRESCVPDRETASVCIFSDGRIRLNTWDCPCDDRESDWFCGGDCSLTAPLL